MLIFSMIGNIPLKGVSFSDFICTFAAVAASSFSHLGNV